MSETIKGQIARIIDKYILSKSVSFRKYVNSRSNKFGIYDLHTSNSNSSINDVLGDYKFYDIQPEDIVLDIGANIGAFSLLVCRSVKHVFAIERTYRLPKNRL